MTGHRAFSMIELVIVIAIIGVIAGVAAPRYGQAAARYRALLAGKRVAEELRIAADHARANEVDVTASVDILAETVTIIESSGPFTGSIVTTTDIAAAPYRANVYLSLRGVVVGSPSFTPGGLADADASIAVMSGRYYVVIDVTQGSATVSVSELRYWGGGLLDLDVPDAIPVAPTGVQIMLPDTTFGVTL